jgi:NDP-sugar pyrophosphorylase family protein
VDILINIKIDDMFKYHQRDNAIATLAVRDRNTTRYLQFDKNLCLVGRFKTENSILNNNEISLNKSNILAFSGIHIINSEIFDLIKETGVFSIIDFYLRICNEHRIIGYLHNLDSWMDCGTYAKIKTML